MENNSQMIIKLQHHGITLSEQSLKLLPSEQVEAQSLSHG